MGAITINDLSIERTLDRKSMSSIKGAAGAPWAYGWITPYTPETPRFGSAVNFYQINNSFYAENIINKSQTINIENSGANSSVNAVMLNILSA